MADPEGRVGLAQDVSESGERHPLARHLPARVHLDQLVLENSIVTLDAMGRQTAIAVKILARVGDYLLMLKGNHPLAHAAVVEHFDQHCRRRGASCRTGCDAFDDTHGRLVRRSLTTSGVIPCACAASAARSPV